MRLIAHRGGRGFGTDNSIEAMESAVRAGVRAIETDVRCTEDGKLIICHDASVWGRSVSKTPYAEIQRWSPVRPLLAEVLERLAGWVTFNIEIKEAPARHVAELLDLYGVLQDTIVTSFDWDIIEEYNRVVPSALTGHLYRMPYGYEKKLHRSVRIGSRLIAPWANSIDDTLVEKAHGLGLEVCAWTVNDEQDLRKFHRWGVDWVITDHYLRMREVLAELEGAS